MVTHVLSYLLDTSSGCPTDTSKSSIQQWTKLPSPQSHKNGWGHSQEPIFLCSVIPSAWNSPCLAPWPLSSWSFSWKKEMVSFPATTPVFSLPSTLCPLIGWRVFIIDASGLTLLICLIIYKTVNLSMFELLNKYQWEWDLVPDKLGICSLWPGQGHHGGEDQTAASASQTSMVFSPETIPDSSLFNWGSDTWPSTHLPGGEKYTDFRVQPVRIWSQIFILVVRSQASRRTGKMGLIIPAQVFHWDNYTDCQEFYQRYLTESSCPQIS